MPAHARAPPSESPEYCPQASPSSQHIEAVRSLADAQYDALCGRLTHGTLTAQAHVLLRHCVLRGARSTAALWVVRRLPPYAPPHAPPHTAAPRPAGVRRLAVRRRRRAAAGRRAVRSVGQRGTRLRAQRRGGVDVGGPMAAQRRGGGQRPVLRVIPLMHAFHARRDRVAPLPPCRFYGAATRRAAPLGPGVRLSLPCGWDNAGQGDHNLLVHRHGRGRFERCGEPPLIRSPATATSVPPPPPLPILSPTLPTPLHAEVHQTVVHPINTHALGLDCVRPNARLTDAATAARAAVAVIAHGEPLLEDVRVGLATNTYPRIPSSCAHALRLT